MAKRAVLMGEASQPRAAASLAELSCCSQRFFMGSLRASKFAF